MRNSLSLLMVTLLAVGCGGELAGPPGETTEGYTYQCSAHGTISGVDVSHFQGNPDWNAVHASGRQFAFVKASEATDLHDSSFGYNWNGVRNAGMVRGAYHFLRANVDGAAQANYFVDFVNANGGFGPGDLPMLDLETTDGMSAAAVANAASAFLAQVRARTGKTAALYTDLSFWQSTLGNPNFSGYPLFIADYSGAQCPRMPTSWPRWALWQYGDGDHVAGIGGTVDGDLFNGTVQELQALGSGTSCGGSFSPMGAIAGKYISLGGCGSFLGAPTSDELGCPDGVGRYNYFQGGAIYYTVALGAHEIHGNIFGKWTSLNREAGILGYPITDETGTPDGVGRFNHFQNGSIYWTPAIGPHEVHGAIGGHWAQLGWERSALGYPTSDEQGTPDGVGRYNYFQNGAIYHTPALGPHEVQGDIFAKWTDLGREQGALGYPISDEHDAPSGRQSDFQHGSLVWDRNTHVVSVVMN